MPYKNDVIQYKWPMKRQYTFYFTIGQLNTGLSLVICIVWCHFITRYKRLWKTWLKPLFGNSNFQVYFSDTQRGNIGGKFFFGEKGFFLYFQGGWGNIIEVQKYLINIILEIKLLYGYMQGSKGIRQWPINWISSPMIIQNYPFGILQLMFEKFRYSTKWTNQSKFNKGPQSC